MSDKLDFQISVLHQDLERPFNFLSALPGIDSSNSAMKTIEKDFKIISNLKMDSSSPVSSFSIYSPEMFELMKEKVKERQKKGLAKLRKELFDNQRKR